MENVCLLTPQRKPETEFYLLACSRNGIIPEEAVFLDDIGMYDYNADLQMPIEHIYTSQKPQSRQSVRNGDNP